MVHLDAKQIDSSIYHRLTVRSGAQNWYAVASPALLERVDAKAPPTDAALGGRLPYATELMVRILILQRMSAQAKHANCPHTSAR